MELQDFPLEAPIVTPESNIVHPNIDHYVTGVCLNLLLEWSTYEGEPNVVWNMSSYCKIII